MRSVIKIEYNATWEAVLYSEMGRSKLTSVGEHATAEAVEAMLDAQLPHMPSIMVKIDSRTYCLNSAEASKEA